MTNATALRYLAPAKLNLFLHITGRRADGYHELQTLFQLLNFGDSLLFQLTDDPGLSLHVDARSTIKDVPLDDNLILRAAHLLLQHSGKRASARIQLSKHIPLGAGLGGGSSDAATTLLALNRLWELNLSQSELADLGLQLGADVPLFVLGKSAWAEGVGEQLEPVELPDAWYVVVMPDCQVSTAQIFTQEHLTRNTSAIKMADFLAGRSRNDCESVTCGLYPEVEKALDWLRQYGPARMTGTGAAIFTRFDDEASARAVLDALPASQQGFIAQGANSSLEPELHED